MVGRGGAGPAGSERSLFFLSRTFDRGGSLSPAPRPCGAALPPTPASPPAPCGWGARGGAPREPGVPGHCLGRARFRCRREGAGWSGGGEGGGGEAGIEPSAPERPSEPRAWRGRADGPRRASPPRRAAGCSYYACTPESADPGPQLPPRPACDTTAPLQVLDPRVEVPAALQAPDPACPPRTLPAQASCHQSAARQLRPTHTHTGRTLKALHTPPQK